MTSEEIAVSAPASAVLLVRKRTVILKGCDIVDIFATQDTDGQ